jgi:hypothetical protein
MVCDATSPDRAPETLAGWLHGTTFIRGQPDAPLTPRSTAEPTQVRSGGPP